MRKFFLCVSLFYLPAKAFSQGELPVDLYTGTPSINIPIHTISATGISDDISLYYSPGVKVKDGSGLVGAGWNLSLGGHKLSREVRGFPDDLSTSAHIGWLYSGAGGGTLCSQVGAFLNYSDQSITTCPDETNDYQKLTAWGVHDTEPDVFSFSAPGISGKFIFDNTGAIALIPHQDIQIIPTFASATNKAILAFTIKTNDGRVYTFGRRENQTRSTTSTIIPQFLSTLFQLYNPAPRSYTKTWLLTTAATSTGATLQYTYSTPPQVSGVNVAMNFHIRKYYTAGNQNSATGYHTQTEYTDSQIDSTYRPLRITSSTGSIIEFSYNADGQIKNIYVRDFRDGDYSSATSKLVKQYVLSYQSKIYQRYLVSLQEISGTERYPAYTFAYNSYLDVSPSDKAVDFWGYYNGKTSNQTLSPVIYVYPSLPAKERYRIYAIPNYSGTVFTLPGADRNVDPNFVTLGTLKMITYPWGGSTSLVFEPNEYFDAVANAKFYGGSLRLKSTTYQDALFSGSKITKSFEYTDINGVSTGRIIAPPSFAIPVWKYINPLGAETLEYSSALTSLTPANVWDYFTVRSEIDLTGGVLTHGSPVGYKEVKVIRPNTGYAKYEYEMPGTWGDAGTATWIPTMVKFARPSFNCSTNPSILDIAKGYEYPFSSLSTIDDERGLVRYCREFNEANNLVRLTETTYQNISIQNSPLAVYGVRFERLPNTGSLGPIYLFSKYSLYTNYVRVFSTENQILYEDGNQTRFTTNLKAHQYNSSFHKLLSRVDVTDASNTIYKSYIRYPQDYGTLPASPADAASISMAMLQSSTRRGIPVESYSTVQKSGDVEKVVGGSITKFRNFSTNKPLPEKFLSWKAITPLTESSYIKSYIDATLKTFKCDPGYSEDNTILSYDTLDFVKSSKGIDGIVNTAISSSKLSAVVVTALDVDPNHFAFSDFEIGTEASFTISPLGGVSPVGRTGTYGLPPSKKLSKFFFELADKEYMISGWCNKFNAGLTVIYRLMNDQKTVTYINQSFTIPPADPNAGFQYFEFPISMASLPIDVTMDLTTYHEISFTPTGTITPTPILDDIALYPQRATLSSLTYTFPFGVQSATQNARTVFKVYNNLGLIKYEMDTDKNIVKRNTYQSIIVQGPPVEVPPNVE
jgi:hypothetical protein